MKKLPAFLNNPTKLVIAVGLCILLGEFLIMLLFESFRDTLLSDTGLEMMALEFIDPILLSAIIAPALYFLIFRPLRQQLDELRSFQQLSIGRELRMKELTEEIAALRNPLSAEPAGIPVASGSLQAPRDAAAQHVTAQPTEQSQRSALLFMLEDLEAGRRKVEQAHREWIAALDVVDDPIFLHDKQFNILRCNKAYQQRAGIPFDEIIGQPYYEIFPKADTPLPCCLRAMEKAEEEEEVAVGDATYRSRSFSVHDEQGIHLYSVHTLEDITESKHAEVLLVESEEKFRKITESAQDAIIMMGVDQCVSFWNAGAGRIFGYTAEEALGQNLHLLITPPAARAAFVHGFQHFIESGEGPVVGKVIEVTALRKDGEEFPVELSISATQLNGQWHAIGIVRDITERKRAEGMIVKEKEKFRMLFDAISDTVVIHGMDGCFLQVNRSACEHFGYSQEELLQKNVTDIDTPEFAAKVAERIKKLQERGQLVAETAHIHKDGTVIPVELSARIINYDGQPAVLSVARDITERKQAEITLRESEERYRSLFQNMLEGYAYCKMLFEHDTPLDFIYLNVNDAFEKITGLKDVVGKKVSEVIPGIRESNPELFEIYGRVVLSGQPERFETYVNALGIWLSVTAYSPHEEYFVAVFDDITERKQAEAAVEHANRALATLSAVNRTLVHVTNEDELLQAICQTIAEQRGYRMAWVGYKQHDENKSIKIMAHAGPEGYLDGMQLTWAETERGMGPSGRTVRSGATQVCQDIANDPQYLPWRDEALKRGMTSSIALPLKNVDNAVFGILSVCAGEVNAFTPVEISLLEEMAGDLAFGVRSLHVRSERDLTLVKNQQQLVQLQGSLEDTMRAIAGIVEMRDPYTSGHQVRVADLAAAIARQMGLPEEQAHAIHLAGTVHDLGKIQIPAEILSKPGRITDIEYSLIKIHPQAGYDILKGITFPWPIAQMVLQHHERLDGSGYPHGLKGEAILLEARILGVADVVEAMSSHRPYRPGLGIEVALGEITKQRGIYFDTQVVDACLVLFHEQHYSFKS